MTQLSSTRLARDEIGYHKWPPFGGVALSAACQNVAEDRSKRAAPGVPA
jgi:hypothetical protein